MICVFSGWGVFISSGTGIENSSSMLHYFTLVGFVDIPYIPQKNILLVKGYKIKSIAYVA